MGVMHRDGLITKGNDRVIAQASFVLAAAAARTNEARNRALNNFNRLDAVLSNEEKAAVGCMRLSKLEEAFRTATENTQPLVKGAGVKDSQSKMRDAIPPSFSTIAQKTLVSLNGAAPGLGHIEASGIVV